MAMESPGVSPLPTDSPAKERKATNKTCYLLEKTLPELRLLIYETYFATFKVDYTTIDIYSSLQPPLLHVCRLIRSEALSAYEARTEQSKRTIIETRELERQRVDQEYDENVALSATQKERALLSKLLVKQMKAGMKANRAHIVELARIQVLRDGEVESELKEWLETLGKKLGTKVAWSIEE